MSKKEPLTPEQFRTGAALLAIGLGVQTLIFAPKKDLEVGDRTVSVSGILPKVQGNVAEAAKFSFNEILPKMAARADRLVDKTKLREKVRDKIVEVLYDDLDQYSLNDLIRRTGVLSKNDVINAATTAVHGLAKNHNNQENLASGIADNFMNSFKTMTDGTAASLLFSEKNLETVKTSVTDVLHTLFGDRFQDSRVGEVLDRVYKLEHLTVGNFLTDQVGIPKEEMGDVLDGLYSKYLGDDRIRKFTEDRVGDRLFTEISEMAYEDFYENFVLAHVKDFLNLAVRFAGLGLTAKSALTKVSDRRASRGKGPEKK